MTVQRPEVTNGTEVKRVPNVSDAADEVCGGLQPGRWRRWCTTSIEAWMASKVGGDVDVDANEMAGSGCCLRHIINGEADGLGASACGGDVVPLVVRHRDARGDADGACLGCLGVTKGPAGIRTSVNVEVDVATDDFDDDMVSHLLQVGACCTVAVGHNEGTIGLSLEREGEGEHVYDHHRQSVRRVS